MRRIRIISFTKAGYELNKDLCRRLTEQGNICSGVSGRSSCAGEPEKRGNVKALLLEEWGDSAFLFIGAAGIAVRYIAPFVKDKFTDSPVLVMDEAGRFVIPLLSGHVGGAAKLAGEIADLTGAVPVITTATDIRKKFAVDMFAKKNGMSIPDRRLAKEISAAVLSGEKIGFYSEFPVAVHTEGAGEGIRDGDLPPELALCRSRRELSAFHYGIAVVARPGKTGPKEENVLLLAPRILYAGVGCRRGVSGECLKKELEALLLENGFRTEQLAAVASIDRKADEEGICALAAEYDIPFLTYTAEELNRTGGVSDVSEFVKRTVGTDNVCERAAVLAGWPGEVVMGKRRAEQMTFAFVKKAFKLEI